MRRMVILRLFIAALLAIGAFAYYDRASHVLQNLTWTSSRENNFKPFDLAALVTTMPRGEYKFLADVDASDGKFYFYVDDCLKAISVNSRPVPLEQVFYSTPVCIGKGYVAADLRHFLRPGLNKVLFTVENYDGLMGVAGSTTSEDTLRLITFLLLASSCLVGLAPLLSRLRFSRLDRGIFFICAFTLVAYTLCTRWDNRAHDVIGHLEYFLKLLQMSGLPLDKACWECSQQPTYYVALSGIYLLINRWLLEPQTMLVIFQFVQVVCGLGFLGVVWQLLAELELAYPSLGFMLIGSWVTGVLHFARIGNDAPTYLFSALAILYIVREWRTGRLRDRLWAAAYCLLAVAIKLTAAFLLPALLVLQIPKLFRGRLAPRLRHLGFLLGFACLSVTTYVLKPLLAHESHTRINTASDELRVPTTLANFTEFSPYLFFRAVAADPWHDANGRQLFWNYLFKSALHGEFEINNFANREIGTLQDLLFFAIAALFVFAIFKHRLWHWRKPTFPLLLTTAAALPMLICFRVLYPYSCNQDFRYVYPTILALGVLGAIRNRAASLLVIVFAGLNICFIWTYVFTHSY